MPVHADPAKVWSRIMENLWRFIDIANRNDDMEYKAAVKEAIETMDALAVRLDLTRITPKLYVSLNQSSHADKVKDHVVTEHLTTEEMKAIQDDAIQARFRGDLITTNPHTGLKSHVWATAWRMDE